MLRITIELVPHGDETRKKHLGTAEIWNDGTSLDRPARGNYGFRLSKWGRPKANWKTGEFKNFKRKSRGVWDLLFCVLRVAVGNRNQ